MKSETLPELQPPKIRVSPMNIDKAVGFVDYLGLKLNQSGHDRLEFISSERQSIIFTDPEIASFAWNRFLVRCHEKLSEEEIKIFQQSLSDYFIA